MSYIIRATSSAQEGKAWALADSSLRPNLILFSGRRDLVAVHNKEYGRGFGNANSFLNNKANSSNTISRFSVKVERKNI